MNNVNDTYFDGHYKEIWRTIIPDELTIREVDFMASYFNLQPGNKILDLMCGYGRHSLALAKKGMNVTAVDNLSDYIDEIQEISTRDQLPIQTICHDILNYKPKENFDLAICMGNSLNFFNAEDTGKVLSTISQHLNKSGSFLINTWSLLEIAIKSLTSKTWATVGELKCLSDSKFLFHPTRIETESTIIDPDGNIEKKEAIDYLFSVNEIEIMLNRAGLKLMEMFSIPGKKKFTVGEPRAYIVATKNI